MAALPSHPLRSQLLVIIGFETGLRTSEICGLRTGDLWRNGACVSTLRFSKRRLKGGRRIGSRVRSREIPVNDRAREFISRYMQEREKDGPLDPRLPLFPSRQGRRALGREQAWRIIRGIFLQAGLDPARTWSGHSLRRRHIRRVFELSDLETARICAGHASPLSTASYLFLGLERAAECVLEIGRNKGTGGPIPQTGPELLPTENNAAPLPVTASA
jgi:integrase